MSTPSSANTAKHGTKLINIVSPWSARGLSKDNERERDRKPKIIKISDKENLGSPNSLPLAGIGAKVRKDPVLTLRAGHTRSQSQPKVQTGGAGVC